MCVANSPALTRPAQIIGIKWSRSSRERPRKRHRHWLMLVKRRKRILAKDLKREKKMN